MAGVQGFLAKPQKKAVCRSDPKAMELEAAKEILAEVFRIRIPDVEEMIRNRFEEVRTPETSSEEDGLWPQEFRLVV